MKYTVILLLLLQIYTYGTSSVTPEYFILSTISDSNGSIDPNGAIPIGFGLNSSITITPNYGYRVDSVIIDGTNYGPVISVAFNRFLSDHSVIVSFSVRTYEPYDPEKDYGGVGDTVLYEGNLFYSRWWPGLHDYPDSTQLSDDAWILIGPDIVDTLVTKAVVYNSSEYGDDTLIIVTDSSSKGTHFEQSIDTVILPEEVPIQAQVYSKKKKISIAGNGSWFYTEKEGSYWVQLFDFRGRELFQRTVSASAKESHQTGIGTISLSPGIFILKITGSNANSAYREVMIWKIDL